MKNIDKLIASNIKKGRHPFHGLPDVFFLFSQPGTPIYYIRDVGLLSGHTLTGAGMDTHGNLIYCLQGKAHREDGPAWISKTVGCIYFLNGIKIDKKVLTDRKYLLSFVKAHPDCIEAVENLIIKLLGKKVFNNLKAASKLI